MVKRPFEMVGGKRRGKQKGNGISMIVCHFCGELSVKLEVCQSRSCKEFWPKLKAIEFLFRTDRMDETGNGIK